MAILTEVGKEDKKHLKFLLYMQITKLEKGFVLGKG